MKWQVTLKDLCSGFVPLFRMYGTRSVSSWKVVSRHFKFQIWQVYLHNSLLLIHVNILKFSFLQIFWFFSPAVRKFQFLEQYPFGTMKSPAPIVIDGLIARVSKVFRSNNSVTTVWVPPATKTEDPNWIDLWLYRFSIKFPTWLQVPSLYSTIFLETAGLPSRQK